jgi:hypothetical protein
VKYVEKLEEKVAFSGDPAPTLTAKDIREAGSDTLDGAAQIKRNTAAALGWGVMSGGAECLSRASEATQTASDVVQNATGIADNVKGLRQAAKSSYGFLAWPHDHPWALVAINVAATCAVGYCLWRIFHGVGRIERAKVADVNEVQALAGDEGISSADTLEADEEPLEQEQA